ncbi:pectate lyase [Pedobacter sp. HMF7647]|uniref:Pectate lyase n=1 Tax=Hufsiella arboris TaxID=2695275 RepID=A0A7K1Y4I6_9SPHI|nr:pectate lyase [Hufsiella arboris]MXV49483.1 pectate lyase [Hufsiella arboris]
MKICRYLIYSLLLLPFGLKSQVKRDSIADRMLVYQLSNGGWPKQLDNKSAVNYDLPLTETLKTEIKNTGYLHATIDNRATSREINYLVKAYQETGNKDYLAAAEKGIDFILKAQYDNGGWPQYFPDKSIYRAEITYNDDAMINVLTILQNIATQKNGFDAVEKSYVPKAQAAVQKGIDCILKTQVVQNGTKTIWAAQYNQETLQPAKARAFEPASLSTSESVGVVHFLMKIKKPTPEICEAIKCAVAWFDKNKIAGYNFERVADSSMPKGFDVKLVPNADGVVWARFYDLNSNQPIFGDRDNTIKTNLDDLIYERRTGYAWYGSWAKKLIRTEYSEWKLKYN